MKLCPKCGAVLDEVIDGYMCNECKSIFSEDKVIVVRCPICNNELGDLGSEYYCYRCYMSVSKENAVLSQNLSSDNDYDFGGSYYDYEEPDYDSMIDNGENICLNCAHWGVSPKGASYGMICYKGYPTSGPSDSCGSFVQSIHYASYGDEGQYQFNETRRDIAKKLNYWRNNR